MIERAPLDWKSVAINPDNGPWNYDNYYANTPQDYLTFAKADIFEAGLRGLINGLSNAKRAIDCQADSFICALGLQPDNLNKQLAAVGLTELRQTQQGLPLKFRLLSELGIAAPTIVSRMRKLRNALEHEYKRPRRRDVCDAIDVAELFIQACEGRLRSAWYDLWIGSETDVRLAMRYHPEPSGCFEVSIFDHRIASKIKQSKVHSSKLKPGQNGFVAALRFLWLSDINQDNNSELMSFLDAVGVKAIKP